MIAVVLTASISSCIPSLACMLVCNIVRVIERLSLLGREFLQVHSGVLAKTV